MRLEKDKSYKKYIDREDHSEEESRIIPIKYLSDQSLNNNESLSTF